MRAGKWRHRVTLQRQAPTDDDYGQSQPGWTDVGTYWAQVLAQGGSEPTAGEAVRALSNYEVTMRYVGEITPATRLLWGGRVLSVVNTTPDPRARYQTLACVEVSIGA